MSNLHSLYDETMKRLLAPVQPFLEDESITEVMINGPDEIWIESGGRVRRTEVRFPDDHSLEAAARNICQFVGKRLVPENPSLEARLPDGSRVHIVQPPAARKGICIAIRKFSKHKLSLQSLIEFDALTDEAAEFLGLCVSLAKNVIVSGGTGSGKTTLLNCLSAMIGDHERILVLEDSSELQLQQEHVVPLEAQAPNKHGEGGIDIRELLRACLRMRPDRIIIGECRGGEALDMIQSMNSGHSGSLSTVHANNPLDALRRLETLCLMADIGMPIAALRPQVAAAVDLVVQVSRLHDGSRRVTHISEVLDLDSEGHFKTVDLFRLVADDAGEPGRRRLAFLGRQPGFAAEFLASDFAERARHSRACWEARS
jgi:pilus assembly protein CpaF